MLGSISALVRSLPIYTLRLEGGGGGGLRVPRWVDQGRQASGQGVSQEPALAGSPRKASLPSIIRQTNIYSYK